MVLFLDISSFVNTIDKEIEILGKKTNEEINELYNKNIIINENKMVLYNSFRKYYNNKIFIENEKIEKINRQEKRKKWQQQKQ